MRMLVTGGAGFIGSNFVRRSLSTHPDAEITVLDAMTYAAHPANVPKEVRLVQGDICDANLVDQLLRHTDVVVNFAAESHNDNSLRDPLRFVHSNVEGTVTLLETAVRHDVRFHQISTDEVYGDLALDDPARFTSHTPYRPSSPYSASKAAADHFVRAFVRSHGLAATISNCSNNYGPRQHPEKFIPRQIINLIHHEPPRIYGSGDHVRDWIHVDDHNDAVWAILQRGTVGETYLIGAHGERSNLQIVSTLNEIFGNPPENVLHVTDRPGHDRRYAIDPSSTEALGWTPRHSDLREGLELTVEWYRAHPEWWERTRSDAEARYALHERPL